MRKPSLLTALAIGFACSAPTSLADASSVSPRSALQANYDSLYADARHKDVANGLRYFAHDFVGEDDVSRPEMGKPVDWAAIRQIATEYTASSQSIRGQAVITALTVKGSEATATVRHHAVIAALDGKHHWRGVFDAVTQDTWVHGPQGWLMQRGRALSLQVQRHEH